MSTYDEVRRLVLRTLMPGFVGTDVPAWVEDALDDGLGSVCLYGSNVVSGEQLRDLCTQLHERSPGVVLAVDEEGGDVTRLHYRTGAPYAGNAVLGRIDDVATTAAAAASIAVDLRAAGIDLDLAPVVDVNSSDANPVIGVRSFGADAGLVARHSVAWVHGLQGAGIAACAKHFPGHGDTTADSHHDLPVVEADADLLRARELVPFAAAVRADVACVMTAAVVVPAIDPANPATFSAALLQGVLRTELAFDGVVVSDALDMAGASRDTGIPEAAVRALVAGCDLLCLGSESSEALLVDIVLAVHQAVGSGRLPLARLHDAADRVGALSASVRTARAGTLATDAPATGPDDVRRAFDVSPRAAEWLRGSGTVAIVQVDTASNLAVGAVPWGPAALVATVDPALAAYADRVAVVGRDMGATHPAWSIADELRAAGRDVIVVECGWPRGGADLVTWGGSPAVATPLVSLLRGEVERA